MATDEEWAIERERRDGMVGFIGALLSHMHRHDGEAARLLLEQGGVLDSPDEARVFLVQLCAVTLSTLRQAYGYDLDKVASYLELMTQVGHGVLPPDLNEIG